MLTFKKLLLLALIPVLVWGSSVGVAEYVYRALGVPLGTNLAIYEPFGDGSYRVKSETTSVQNWFSGIFAIHTDSNGMRCSRNGEDCLGNDSQFDLLVLGDSQAFGQGVEYADSVVGVFGREARQANLITANASVGGHFLLNQLELVESIEPEKTEKMVKALVLLTPRSIAKSQAYSRAFVTEDGQLFDREPTITTRVRTWLRTNMTVYVILRDAVKSAFGSKKASDSLLSLYKKLSNDDRRVDQLENTLSELKRWANARNSQLVVVYLPLAIEFKLDTLTPSGSSPGFEVSSAAPSLIASMAASRIGVQFIDTREALDELARQNVELQLIGDSHYNSAASEAVGKFIWKSLQRRN